MAKSKVVIEFEGFEEVTARLTKLGGDVQKTTEKALKEAHRIVTNKALESVQPQNLPAKGKYSSGRTMKSLVHQANVEWAGGVASVRVGFNIKKGGLPSIFMMYGTPRYMKNQKMYNAFFSKKTRDEIMKIEEDIFYGEIRRLDG